MPKYKIKQGYESIVFSQEGIKRISENEIESENELHNALLTEIKDASIEVQSVTPEAPAAPVDVPTPPVIQTEQTQTEEIK